MEKVDQIKSPYDIQTQIKMTLISNKGGEKKITFKSTNQYREEI